MLWQQVTQRFGIEIPLSDFVKLWRRKYHESWKLHEDEVGRIRTIFDFSVWTESLSLLLQALVLGRNEAETHEIAKASFKTLIDSFEPYSDVKPLLCELKKRGYLLGVISNAKHEELVQILKENDMLGLFDCVVSSSKTGSEKPDLRIFRAALSELECPAAEAVMIGDGEGDMASKELGMTTVFTSRYHDRSVKADHVVHTMSELLDILDS